MLIDSCFWRACSTFLLAAMLVLPAGAAQPQHAGGAEKKPRLELGSSAVFAPQGKILAVATERGHVVLRSSADSGKSWSASRQVNAVAEAVAADGESQPKIALGPAGEVFVSWTRPLAKPYTGEIRFARSLDGGEHFDPPLTVHVDRQEITHRFEAMAVTSQGKIVLVWIDKRDLVLAKAVGREYRGAALYFAVSDDRGASFRGDYRLAEHSCECCRIALSAEADGSVLALWRHVFAPNVRDHALARIYPDGRSEPLRRATFDNWKVDACPHHGPSLATDGKSQLHAVWFTQGDAAGVFYGRLRETDVVGQRKLGGARAAHADIGAQGDAVLLAWKEFDGERTHLHAELSTDGGATWSASRPASTAGASDQPRVLARDGRLAVFWNTQDEGMRLHDYALGAKP